ncbi:MAG: thioredoxin-disulfide reductase [Clostridia bacterium]|uniref:thioredoxin-disulfide reductase n=1 Tax=Desulfitibacter alkalitolerans TaxID=264641 RepID=UPI00054FD81E|nr:thioredoxin-disulfide reductase [Desulfitibacter alkalitolerans]MBS3969300.1 thioredoxin-disulfide reductase [Clostridia bacterium]
MTKEIWDILIVGGGPAGLTAGIYGARSKLKTLILEKGRPGGQAATTEEMENYPGFGRGATGPGIMKAMQEHAEDFGVIIEKETAVDLDLDGEIKIVRTKKGKEFYGKTVILCPGANPRSLGIKGEKKFVGKGVSYCATCDADFYEDLDVIVVGNGDAAIEEAIYLTKFAEKVTVIVIHDEGILDANKASQEKAFANPKIHFIWNSVLEEIKGDGIVESVVIKNLKTGEITDMETNGVFFFVGYVPNTEFLRGKIDLNDQGYIIVNEKMETSVPGVYAAGDANQKYLRQVVTAAADGAIAAFAADKYLAEEENFKMQVLNAQGTVLVAFWSPQKEESIEAVSLLEQNVNQLANTKLVKIDLYRNHLVANRYNVESIPAVLVFENGEVINRLKGSISQEVLRELAAGRETV